MLCIEVCFIYLGRSVLFYTMETSHTRISTLYSFWEFFLITFLEENLCFYLLLIMSIHCRIIYNNKSRIQIWWAVGGT